MPKRYHNKVEEVLARIPYKPLPKFKAGPNAPPEYHDHTMENGRRYRGHRDEYPWPNDRDAEINYSSICCVWTFLLEDEGRDLISAPVTEGKGKGRSLKVMDYGARGMRWMSRVEDRYHDVRITMVDPNCAWMYPTDITVRHELEPENGWSFTARQAFNYIRGVALSGMISDYQSMYRNMYRHLLPGGWVEIRDNDLQFFTDQPSDEKEGKLVALRKWEKLMAEAAEKFGKPINVSARHKEWMEEAGFTEVREEVFKIPWGEWMEGKPWTPFIGSTSIMAMRHGLEGYTLRLFTKTLGWSLDDTKAFIQEVKNEVQDSKLNDLRLYSNFRLVLGKKPEDASRKP